MNRTVLRKTQKDKILNDSVFCQRRFLDINIFWINIHSKLSDHPVGRESIKMEHKEVDIDYDNEERMIVYCLSAGFILYSLYSYFV